MLFNRILTILYLFIKLSFCLFNFMYLRGGTLENQHHHLCLLCLFMKYPWLSDRTLSQDLALQQLDRTNVHSCRIKMLSKLNTITIRKHKYLGKIWNNFSAFNTGVIILINKERLYDNKNLQIEIKTLQVSIFLLLHLNRQTAGNLYTI